MMVKDFRKVEGPGTGLVTTTLDGSAETLG